MSEVSEFNPYVSKAGDQLIISPEHVEKAVQLQKMGFYGQFFSGVDLCLAIFYVATGLFPAVLLGIFSCVGFYGSNRFKRLLVLSYTVYQGVLVVSKIVVLGMIPLSLDAVEMTFQMSILFANIVILIFFVRFYLMIPPPLYEARVSGT